MEPSEFSQISGFFVFNTDGAVVLWFSPADAQETKSPTAAKSAETSAEQQQDVARFKKAHALFLQYLQTEKRYKEAEQEAKTALQLARKLLGNNHLITATEINNLAVLYTSTKRYKLAEPLYQEALKIRQSPAEKRRCAHSWDA